MAAVKGVHPIRAKYAPHNACFLVSLGQSPILKAINGDIFMRGIEPITSKGAMDSFCREKRLRSFVRVQNMKWQSAAAAAVKKNPD